MPASPTPFRPPPAEPPDSPWSSRPRPARPSGPLPGRARPPPRPGRRRWLQRPRAVAKTAAEHGAKLIRRDENGGPGAARNTALDHVTTELVAFVDSDCVAPGDWIDQLAAHFADPLLAAVAPRVRPLTQHTTAGRYTKAAGVSISATGPRASRRGPGSPTSPPPRWSPGGPLSKKSAGSIPDSASARTSTWSGGCTPPASRIRYAPDVHVGHHEPETWRALLGRRARYGTSAAPLARRHPGNLAPLVLHPWPALTVAALLARRPRLAAGGFGGAVFSMRKTLRDNGSRPTASSARGAPPSTRPGSAPAATRPSSPRRCCRAAGSAAARGRRAAVASLLLGPPLTAWAKRRPDLDPVRYTAGALADDIAYGAGVWPAACATAPPRRCGPHDRWRPVRVDSKEKRAPMSNAWFEIGRRGAAARARSACPSPSTAPWSPAPRRASRSRTTSPRSTSSASPRTPPGCPATRDLATTVHGPARSRCRCSSPPPACRPCTPTARSPSPAPPPPAAPRWA